MLRLYKLLFAFCFLNVLCVAQSNLVSNGSFEAYTTCPNALDQMSYCIGWSSYRGTPEYFNSCSSISGFAPPNSIAGYQFPLFGNAYAGIGTYDNSGMGPNSREMIGSQLTSALQIGIKYYFSVFVNLGGGSGLQLAIDKLGLRFSTIPYSVSNPAPISNFAHYYSPFITSDTANWTQLKGSFIADSLYQFIGLGCFFDDSNTNTMNLSTGNQISYYYIDNVCVSTDSNYAYNNSIDDRSLTDLKIYPNPCNDFFKISFNGTPDEVALYDFFGNLCLRQNRFLSSTNTSIDTSELSSGSYLVKIRYKNQNIERQLLIIK